METAKEVKPAKLCFEHIGGKLGMLLMDMFKEKKWIAKNKSCLSPLKGWTRIVNQFSHSKFREHENKKKVYT